MDLNIQPVSGLKGPADSAHTSTFEIVRHTAQFNRCSERCRWVDKVFNVGRNYQTCAHIKYNWYVMVPKCVADGGLQQPFFIGQYLDIPVRSFDQVSVRLCRQCNSTVNYSAITVDRIELEMISHVVLLINLNIWSREYKDSEVSFSQ
jgi:hypothetical protein